MLVDGLGFVHGHAWAEVRHAKGVFPEIALGIVVGARGAFLVTFQVFESFDSRRS